MYIEICPPHSTQHVVKKGDTLWRLSQTYGVSLQSIFDLNPGIDPQNLQVGSTLCIPAAPTPAVPPTMPTVPLPTEPRVPPTMPARPVTCPEGALSHTVQAGDTLWRLSQTYGVGLQSIFDLNPGVDPQNLQVGSTLCIPAAPTPAVPPTMPTVPLSTVPRVPPTMPAQPVTCPEGALSHTVQAGDTLWRLSQTYGVSLQSVFDHNPGIDAQNLQVGSTLCIPEAPTPEVPPTMPTVPLPTVPRVPPTMPARPVTCPEGALSHTVQAGDTLWRLSQTYRVSLQSIFDLNPGIDPQNLQVGSTLCIPAAPTPAVPPIMPRVPLPNVPRVPPTMPARPVACPEGALSHTVQAGDTLWRLSQTYGVGLQSIFDLNPGIDAQNLQVGSILCIPAAPTPAVPPTMPTVPPGVFAYTIKKGDSICKIARRFYVSEESILQNNPKIDPRCLRAGTYLYIPINCCGENTCRYTVRAGDTLNRIANKFNVCPSALIEANPNIDFHNLVNCQIICIPNA